LGHYAGGRRTLEGFKSHKGKGNQGCRIQALKEQKARRVIAVFNG
jgi:hypothetical protein